MLRLELFDDLPLLADACQRLIAPDEPGPLVGNAFAPLKQKSLDDGSLVFWFRRQLGLRDPPIPDRTEADLLLVLAAGLYAARLPAAQIKRTRVGLFVTLVRFRKWRRVLGYAHAAAELLARVLEARPDLPLYEEAAV